MAKLGKRQAEQVACLLNRMAAAAGQEKRNELLIKLLDVLGIDEAQRAEGAEVARYLMQKEARSPKPPITLADIITLNPDGTIDSDRDKFDAASSKVQGEVLDYLRKLCDGEPAKLPKPQQTPSTNDDAPRYNVTAKQRRRLAAFDDMTDADQIDTLHSLWGEDGRP